MKDAFHITIHKLSGGQCKAKFRNRLAISASAEQILATQEQKGCLMKHHFGKLFGIVPMALALVGLKAVSPVSAVDTSAVQAVAETRQQLHQQGFKTDLAEFDLATSPELRAREAILTNTVHQRFDGTFPENPNLMQPVGNNSAIVVWKLDALKRENRARWDDSDQLAWEEFRDAINANQSLYDPACLAILSGPIRFNLNAQKGSAMLLPHLAVMKRLAQTMGDRMLLALHDGNLPTAWTNLLAETRLTTAFDPGPVDIAHMVRFACAVFAYNATWQALQTNGWTDEQLAQLQREWEAMDYFSPLPETAAFKRACAVADCEREQSGEDDPKPTFSEFTKQAVQFPPSILNELNYRWEQARKRQRGNYDLEKELMLFYRDREVELRNAVKAPTWAAMRPLPGVTNLVVFQSSSHSRVQARLNLRETVLGFQRMGATFLSRAAEIESLRRVLITAIALERYRGAHGAYPKTLTELVPEFVKTVPVDFMDGQPLRYRLTDDGHFLLYSIGLDGVDNGGKLRWSWRNAGLRQPPSLDPEQKEFDLAWPLPASAEAVAALHQMQLDAHKSEADDDAEREAIWLWQHTDKRQAQAAKLLATDAPTNLPDVFLHGHPLSEMLRNAAVAGTNKSSLAEMLTLKQVITGNEPETVTFELPIVYDTVTNLGTLVLMLDPNYHTGDEEGNGPQIDELNRSTNGNCLLALHTIYESLGRHALQAVLFLKDSGKDEPDVSGPVQPFMITNLCQFSVSSSTYDVERGALFRARLPESNGVYSIECVTTNGQHLKTITGTTTNGEFKVTWDLKADGGYRLTGETFNSIVHITLPDSGRSQTLRGP